MRLVFALLSLGLILRAADGPPIVVRAPDHSPGPVTPGEIVILRSPDAGPRTLAGNQLGDDGKVTTLLGETRVWFDEVAAPLAYSVSGEIMAVVPYEVSNRRTTEVVVEYKGKRSAPAKLEVAESGPALFTLDSTGHGQAAMLNELGCCNSVRNPAKRGSTAVLYATGEGQTVPAGITGGVSFYDRAADYPVPRLPVRVTVGGEPAEIVYAGEAPHAVTGLIQVNFRVPKNAPLGDAVPLTLSIGDASSPAGVTMAVRSEVPHTVVMDPNPATRDWLTKVLRDAAFEVGEGPGPVDVVIVSLDISAEERRDAIRAIQAVNPQLRVVALGTVGWLSPAMLKAADLMGAQGVFIKPMAAVPVVAKIRELLRPRPYPD